jgi:starch phosphorylase
MVESLFADFAKIFPHDASPTSPTVSRRWLAAANPSLRGSGRYIGQTWRTDLSQLSELGEYQDYPLVNQAVSEAKLANKQRLADYIARQLGWLIRRRCLMCKLSAFTNTNAS